MRSRGRSGTDSVKPIQKIELHEGGIKKRVIVAVALLAVGLAFLGYAVFKWLSYDEGWTRIEPVSQSGESVASDLILLYELGVSEASATAEYKAVAALYTELCSEAYRIFHADYGFEDVHNPYYINRNVGQEIEVDPALYRAFEQIDRSGERFLFAAPYYTEYRNLFLDTQDSTAELLDPYKSESVAEYFAELSTYTSSEDHVRLELLGNNKVKLCVSDEFQNFARENAIDSYIDFWWAKNAFVVDYIADELIGKGYVYGSISAHDGFMRTFDPRETSYSYNLTGRYDGSVYNVGRLEYTGQSSIVFLRAFEMTDRDMMYYRYEDGQERHGYVDWRDGLCKNSVDMLVSYSEDKGCGEVLLSVMPLYIADVLDTSALTGLSDEGVYSIYTEGSVLYHTQETVKLRKLFEGEKVKFSTSYLK